MLPKCLRTWCRWKKLTTWLSNWKPKKSGNRPIPKKALPMFKEVLSVIPHRLRIYAAHRNAFQIELITGVRPILRWKGFGETGLSQRKATEIKQLIRRNSQCSRRYSRKQRTSANECEVQPWKGFTVWTWKRWMPIWQKLLLRRNCRQHFRRWKALWSAVRLQKENRTDIENIRQLQRRCLTGCRFRSASWLKFVWPKVRQNFAWKYPPPRSGKCEYATATCSRWWKIFRPAWIKCETQPGRTFSTADSLRICRMPLTDLFLPYRLHLALIFIFLHFAFKSLKDTIMIFTAVPLSVVGCVCFVAAGMPFSISGWFGFYRPVWYCRAQWHCADWAPRTSKKPEWPICVNW